MKSIREIFKDKKNYYSILTAIFLSILLLILSDNFLKSNKKEKTNIDYKGQSINLDEDKNSYEAQLEKRLENILSKVQGVGNIDVMITLENGKEIVTKEDKVKENSTTNEEALNGDKRQIISDKEQISTVKISGDEPLILKELTPKISGVLIVAQGGGNIDVKNMLIKSASALLGVEIHKIEVLQMK
ncbi:hypothetical protein [uncultured Tyzzerella sp.]|uniref:hypothetical protein n=1 Tax=uncultured Tyzzerella sp. TaxID=2321398 RepID=UPI00294211E8|nr:hypothetical protein [uncultured Tyzzerella sp.]